MALWFPFVQAAERLPQSLSPVELLPRGRNLAGLGLRRRRSLVVVVA
jgi:hypothetical protein